MFKIGWISTYNTRCGIASHSNNLLQHFHSDVTILASYVDDKLTEDSANVIRCWNRESDNFENVKQQIVNLDLKIIVIQYHPGLIHVGYLTNFLDWLHSTNRVAILMIHSFQYMHQIPANIALCRMITVQTQKNYDRLSEFNLQNKLTIFPLGINIKNTAKMRNNHDYFLLGSYGFFLPNKGIDKLLIAFHVLRDNGLDYRLRLVNCEYPTADSDKLIEKAKDYVKTHKLEEFVEFHTTFLTDDESTNLLKDCDLIVNPYQNTAEPTSASVRQSLSTGVPVLVTTSTIFDDVRDITFQMDGMDSTHIISGIYKTTQDIMEKTDNYNRVMKNLAGFCYQNNYKNLANRLENMIESIK